MKSTDGIILEVIISKGILKYHAEIATWPQGIIQADEINSYKVQNNVNVRNS